MPRQYLLDTLTQAEIPSKLAACMDDVGRELAAAILVAIAGAESNYDAEAVGDNGDSFGLWQINAPTWGGPPSEWQVLGTQMDWVVGPACEYLPQIRWTERRLGIRLNPEAAATAVQVSWQYGGAAWRHFVNSSPVGLTAARFVAHHKSRGYPTWPHRARADRIARELKWALRHVTDAPKKKGALGTAYTFWSHQAGRLPGGGNLPGWGLLILAGYLVFRKVTR